MSRAAGAASRLAAWAALAAGIAGGVVPAQAARIERTQASFTLPPGRSVLSPYVNAGNGAVVLHVQPLQASQAESLLDARTGRAWSGDLNALLRDFAHLGTEVPADTETGAGADLRLLRALGCTRSHIVCTSVLDAEVLLLLAPSGRDGATLTVLDLRAVLAEMEALLAGRIDPATLDWGDAEWLAIEAVSRRPERRARWSDAVRSIGSAAAFQRVLAAYQSGPQLGARALFSGSDPALDLRAELELLGHRLIVGERTVALLSGGGAAALSSLGDALIAATQPPNQIGVATHLVDLLASAPPDARGRLARDLAAEGERRRSDVLRCFAAWVAGRACGGAAPSWVGEAPAPATAAPPAAPPGTSRQTPRTLPQAPSAGPRAAPAPEVPPVIAPGAPVAAPAPSPSVPIVPNAGDAPHEWTLIQAVPNKLQLVAFNEASGRMVPDRAIVGGFSFIARALGPVQDGRFEIEVANAGGAPVRLRHGQYRVRARLVLDFTREDQCVQGISCWFSRPELHAKSVPRDVVFFMTVGGRYVDRRRTEFGHLLPLVADGNARYRSQLKEARLAIESVRFELL